VGCGALLPLLPGAERTPIAVLRVVVGGLESRMQ
jgi:hypothetical protein